jgi:hypothetical protein
VVVDSAVLEAEEALVVPGEAPADRVGRVDADRVVLAKLGAEGQAGLAEGLAVELLVVAQADLVAVAVSVVVQAAEEADAAVADLADKITHRPLSQMTKSTTSLETVRCLSSRLARNLSKLQLTV